MRKIALAAAAAALIVSAAPVTAEEPVVVPTPACETSTEFTTLGLAGAKQAVTPSSVPSIGTDFDDLVETLSGQDVPNTPYHPQSAVTYKFRLDLSGSPTVPTAKTGNVKLDIAWDNDGDYDLYVYDTQGKLIGEGANGFNPLDGAGESMSLSRAAHCTDFVVDIVNYAGVSAATKMDLIAKVSSLKP